MRTTQLVTIALQAEKLRLQRQASRAALRAVFVGVGSVFALVAILFLHVAGYTALCLVLAPYWSALVVAGIDLLVALLFLAIAFRRRRDSVAEEASLIRDDAWNQLRSNLTLTAAVQPLSRILGRKSAYGLGLAALLTQFLSRREAQS